MVSKCLPNDAECDRVLVNSSGDTKKGNGDDTIYGYFSS